MAGATLKDVGSASGSGDRREGLEYSSGGLPGPPREDSIRAEGAAGESDFESPDFESLLCQHQAMVFSLAYHFLQDRGRAEEVAQDVFLSLHGHLDQMKSSQHTLFWLRKVTAQRSIDAARRSRRRWFHRSLQDAPEPATAPAPADPLREETVWRMVGRLPAVPRLVVILRYQEDLGPAEIAAALELPVATVKSHLQRSLAVLREKLGGLLGPARRGGNL